MPAPTITEVVPATGTPVLGVYIQGSGFHYDATVEFGPENWAEHVSFRTPELLYVAVPQGSGTVAVMVTNPDKQKGTLANAFTYDLVPPPTITEVVPVSGTPVLGVNIYGSGFHYESSVEFGAENEAEFVSFRTPGHLYVVVPQGTGTVNVIVTNPDKQQATLPNGFTYDPVPAPTITEVVPATGTPVLGVYVEGSGFHYDATVEFGSENWAEHVSFRTPELLYVVVPQGAGTVAVIVTNPDGGQDTLENAFTYEPVPPPAIDEVIPTSGTPVLGVNVKGSGFHYESTVEFGANEAEFVSFRTPEHLYVVVPPGIGTVNVTVTNPDGGQDTLLNAFTYELVPAPTVQVVVPAMGPPILGVDVNGFDFHYDATVKFGAEEAEFVSFRTPEHLFVAVPPGTGTVDVTVTNPDTLADSLANGFTYQPAPDPTIIEISPDTGAPVLGIDIVGTGFHHEVTVEFGTGNYAEHVSFRTPAHLYVVVPDGTDTVDVIVTNPDGGQVILTDGFTYEVEEEVDP